jgi:hypothetical protein
MALIIARWPGCGRFRQFAQVLTVRERMYVQLARFTAQQHEDHRRTATESDAIPGSHLVGDFRSDPRLGRTLDARARANDQAIVRPDLLLAITYGALIRQMWWFCRPS